MAIVRETVIYDGPGGPFEGVLVHDEEVEAARPGVLIVPNVLGQKDADSARAEDVVKLGYVGFVCDLYGQGRRTTRASPDPAVYLKELDADRMLLRDRLAASLDRLKGFDQVDAAKVAAMGYCFGGKAVLDMARAGLDFLGGVSFHGVYDPPGYPVAAPLAAKLLVCHGWDDPLNPPASVKALGAELTDAGADWQVHAYGHAGHAFTDLEMTDSTRPGFGYDARADRRSWAAARAFFAELFV